MPEHILGRSCNILVTFQIKENFHFQKFQYLVSKFYCHPALDCLFLPRPSSPSPEVQRGPGTVSPFPWSMSFPLALQALTSEGKGHSRPGWCRYSVAPGAMCMPGAWMPLLWRLCGVCREPLWGCMWAPSPAGPCPPSLSTCPPELSGGEGNGTMFSTYRFPYFKEAS